MALIGHGDRQGGVPAHVAESVFLLNQEFVVKPRLVVHHWDSAGPQGADRKHVERLITAANTGRDENQILSREQITQGRILIIG